jgi:RimJ/RimL family protein N-acetyltransferase
LSANEGTISLRPATMDDRERVFRWRNDPFVVAHGSFLREIDWEDHKKWFEKTILGDSRKMFIILDQGNPIGQIRFDRHNQREAVVSVYLLRAFTGRGLGVRAIGMGCAAIFEAWAIDRVIACVRQDNLVGRSAFLKSGFHETDAAGMCPSEHFSLILARG